MKALIVALLLALALPAQAHTESEIDEWELAWQESVDNLDPADPIAPALFIEFMQARRSFEGRHYCHYEYCAPRVVSHQVSPSRGMGDGDVERWRPLVAKYFSNVDRALCLVRYESGANPNARNPSGASGLFQVMPFWFSHFGGSAFDPENNTRVAALVLAEQGWTAWAVVNKGKC